MYYSSMILHLLITFSIGIEGGYNQPAVGFDNLNAGSVFAIFMSRDFGISNIALAVENNFSRGKNSSYAVNRYGFRFGFSKSNWHFSPALELGVDYINRELNKVNESGYVMNYVLGFLINFKVNRLRMYPKFYYDGFTDYKIQAGFIGIKFGVDYEI